ncbi:MAG: type II toxin-antitoxin system RelE/ParE family toxin [Planctomycetota bacterium]
MSYTVCLESSAERDLKRLPRDVLRRVDMKLLSLAQNPRPHGVRKLAGREGDGWRVRIGDYRILYTIDDEARTVSVYRIRSRPTAYR